METPDFVHGRVYFKQFGAERVKILCLRKNECIPSPASIEYMTLSLNSL